VENHAHHVSVVPWHDQGVLYAVPGVHVIDDFYFMRVGNIGVVPAELPYDEIGLIAPSDIIL
jgi:hypothetical protein